MQSEVRQLRQRSIYFALLPALLFFAFLSSIQADENACLVNFGQRQCGPFEILPDVIVKAALSKQQLQQRLGRPVTQLAMLGDVNLYLIPSDHPQSEAERLSHEAGILYAQPDVVQPRSLHGYPVDAGGLAAALPEDWFSNGGKGVKIAVIDDGFNLDHEDLQGAVIGFSYDADLKQLGAGPQVRIDRHGTRVAGIMLAQHNGKGSMASLRKRH